MPEKDFDVKGTLWHKAVDLLSEDTRTTSTLSLELKIPLHWLSKMREGKIKGPSVNKIEYILNKLEPTYLNKNK